LLQKRKKHFLSFETLLNKYFEQRKEGKGKQSDISSANKHILPFFINKNIEIQTKEDIRAFKKLIKSKTNQSGMQLSNKTINNILTLFSSIINYGLKEELLKNDYRKYIEMDSVRNERDRFLTIEEITVLYDYLKSDKRLFLFSKIALTTGARLASILFISKKDIDFSNKLLTLHDLKKDQDARVTYKTFLTDELTVFLRDWTKNLNLTDKIFKENPTSIQRQMLKILDNLFNQGINSDDRQNKVVVHTLRHTFASHLAIKETPIFTIQKLMNHSDIKMTLRYAKLASESGKDAILGLYK